jgi:hypothetical protein
MMKEETKQLKERDIQVRIKKRYQSPRLVVHGDIEVITQGPDEGDQEAENLGNSIGGDI